MDLILPVISTKKTVKLRINYPIEHLEAGNGTISNNHFSISDSLWCWRT